MEELLNKFYCSVGAEITLRQLIEQLLPKKNVVVIGIEGAAGSGKTVLGRKLLEEFSSGKSALILIDDYLRFSSEEMKKMGILTRYDWHSRDREKFLSDIALLKNGLSINKPVQDFSKEIPSKEIETIESKPYIIIEGNLDISNIADIIIFLFAPDEVLAQRRFSRDSQKQIHEDEAKLKSAIDQSLQYYHQFLEPAAVHAQIIINTDSGVVYRKL